MTPCLHPLQVTVQLHVLLFQCICALMQVLRGEARESMQETVVNPKFEPTCSTALGARAAKHAARSNIISYVLLICCGMHGRLLLSLLVIGFCWLGDIFAVRLRQAVLVTSQTRVSAVGSCS